MVMTRIISKSYDELEFRVLRLSQTLRRKASVEIPPPFALFDMEVVCVVFNLTDGGW